MRTCEKLANPVCGQLNFIAYNENNKSRFFYGFYLVLVALR